MHVAASVSVDFAKVHERMLGIVGQSTAGLTKWLESTEHLAVIRGHARFSSPTTNSERVPSALPWPAKNSCVSASMIVRR